MTVGMFHGSEKYQQSQLWDAPSLPVVWHLCYTLSSSEFDVQDTQHDNFVQHSTNLPSRSSCLFQHSRKLTNSLAWTRVKTCPGLPRSTLHKSCYHACLNNLSHLSDWMAVDPLHLEPYSVRWGRMGKHEQPHQVCFIRRRLHMKMKHLSISRTRKAITMAAYCMMHDFRAQGTRTILSLLSIKWSERDCSIDITKYIPECPSDSWENSFSQINLISSVKPIKRRGQSIIRVSAARLQHWTRWLSQVSIVLEGDVLTEILPCAQCGAKTEVRSWEPFHCRECRHRIIYKKQTKRRKLQCYFPILFRAHISTHAHCVLQCHGV